MTFRLVYLDFFGAKARRSSRFCRPDVAIVIWRCGAGWGGAAIAIVILFLFQLLAPVCRLVSQVGLSVSRWVVRFGLSLSQCDKIRWVWVLGACIRWYEVIHCCLQRTPNIPSRRRCCAAFLCSVAEISGWRCAPYHIPYTIYSWFCPVCVCVGGAVLKAIPEPKPQTVALLIHFRHPPCPLSACLAVGGACVVVQLSTVGPGSFSSLVEMLGI